MKVIEELLTKNEYSRSGERMGDIVAVVMHWVGVAGQRAQSVRDFFENRKSGYGGYGSAHYIVDLDGTVIQCIPESEVAFHSGSEKKDPVSGKIYTFESRCRFGAKPDGNGYCPNYHSIGIELCHIDNEGNFTEETLQSAVELVADILRRHKLKVSAVTTHHNLVGWKDCPRLWTKEPKLFEEFKNRVKEALKNA